MIAVCGATGTVGRTVVASLSAARVSVRVLVREPAKARALFGGSVKPVGVDLDRPGTLVPALRGATKAFFVSAVDERYPARVAAFLEAARAAHVPHVVKLGAMEADLESPSAILRGHAQTDECVRTSGLAWTLLQASSFFQNLLGSAKSIRTKGRIHMPLGKARVALVDVRDVGAVAAKVLTGRGHDGKTYELTGPEALTFAEIAAAFARALGRPVEYADVPLADVRERLHAAGLPAWNADEVARLYGVMATGALGRTTGTVKALLRRAPVSFEAWLHEHVDAFGGLKQPRG